MAIITFCNRNRNPLLLCKVGKLLLLYVLLYTKLGKLIKISIAIKKLKCGFAKISYYFLVLFRFYLQFLHIKKHILHVSHVSSAEHLKTVILF